MATDIVVPSLGESVTEATVAQWLKQPGEAVEADEPVVELETEKVTLEVNAPAAGKLSEHVAEEGATVEVGAVLGRIAEGEAASAEPAARKGDGKGEAETAEAPKAEAEPEKPAAPGGGKGETVDVTVPNLGESVTEATLAQWLKQPGEAVDADEAIAELETEKVTLEVNAPQAGSLAEQLVEEGATVEVGAVIARVAAGAAGEAKPAAESKAAPPPREEKAEAPAAAEKAPAEAAAPAQAEAPRLDPDKAPRTGGRVTMADLMAFLGGGEPPALSPAVRKMVSEEQLDPSRIPATGKGGRLTKADVIDFLEGRTEPLAPQAPSAPAGAAKAEAPAARATEVPSAGPREERVKMTKLRQTVAKRLKEAQDTAAMLTTFNEVDMTAVNAIRAQYREAFEKKHGTRLGMSCFFAKAVVAALKEVPEVNARIEDDEIVYNYRYDIGMAVSTPQGLMVPVVRDCDRKSFADIEATLRELAKKGREGKLSMDELQGGTFTITNGGVFGSLLSTPILNMPQSGILGMHKIQDRPMAVDGEVKVRPMMYLALSYDHRIIDGREAVTFLVRIKEYLEDPNRLLLDV